jgi:hypothetical protein
MSDDTNSTDFAGKPDRANCGAPYPQAIKGCREYFSADVVAAIDIRVHRCPPLDFVPPTRPLMLDQQSPHLPGRERELQQVPLTLLALVGGDSLLQVANSFSRNRPPGRMTVLPPLPQCNRRVASYRPSVINSYMSCQRDSLGHGTSARMSLVGEARKGASRGCWKPKARRSQHDPGVFTCS